MQAYTSVERNFSIDAPSGWTVDDTSTGAEVYFFGPTEQDFTVNINVIVGSTTMTLEQYVSADLDNLPSALDNFELVSESTRVINEVDSCELVCTFSGDYNDVMAKQVILIHANTVYVITCATLPTTYQKYLSDFESSIETFQIIDKDVPEFPSVILALAALTAVTVVGVIYKKKI